MLRCARRSVGLAFGPFFVARRTLAFLGASCVSREMFMVVKDWVVALGVFWPLGFVGSLGVIAPTEADRMARCVLVYDEHNEQKLLCPIKNVFPE